MDEVIERERKREEERRRERKGEVEGRSQRKRYEVKGREIN
jgi:hypothetical protein